MEFKFYSDNDYQQLIELWHEAKLPYKPKGRDSQAKIAQSVQNNNLHILLAYQDSKLIGSVIVTHDGRKGWINRLAVHPRCWHQGIASKLIEKAEQILKKNKIEIFACLIEKWNTASLQLFQKNGYQNHPEITYLTKREYKDV